MMADWFAQKRYGYGAGFPIAWQGWVVLAGFFLVIGIAAWLFGPDDPAALSIVVPAILALLIIIARTTRGGWRWRWGGEE
jgi:hypothetical protein